MDCSHGFSHLKPKHRGILLPVSAPQVSNTALAARECLRVVARANPSQAVPVVLEAPMLVGTRCSVFLFFMKYFYGDLMVN